MTNNSSDDETFSVDMTNPCESGPDYTSGDEAMVADYFPSGYKSCKRALTIEVNPNEVFDYGTSCYYMDMEADCSREMGWNGYDHPKSSERLSCPIWMATVDKVLDKAGCRRCNHGQDDCTCRVDKYIRWVKTTNMSGDGFLHYD
jgi:hypothetical protein